MTDEVMKKLAIKVSVFAALSMLILLHRCATKHIMITDAAGAPIDRGDSGSSYSLLVDRNVPEGKQDILIIPLSRSVSSDNIILEDRYADHEISIHIDSREDGFYLDNPIVTDLDILESAVCINENDSGKVCLNFVLDGLYCNESAMTDANTIEIKFSRPKDKYSHVAVVDVRGGGSDSGASAGALSEKDITLKTALLLKEISDKDTDNDIKIYFTRLTDRDTSTEQRSSLIQDSQADLLVELSVDAASQMGGSGIASYYNDRYFLRTLTNAELADIMLRSMAAKGAGSVLGADTDGEDEVLLSSGVPSARVSLGVVGSTEDAERLSDEEYLKRAAEGIYSGILSSFEVMR